MKIVYKKHIKSFKNNPVCTAFAYPTDDKTISGAVIELTGRYPTKGRVVNLKCKEMAYIIKGSGSLVVEGKKVLLKVGDLVLIDAGERYCWDGKMTMFMPCAPAWYPEQHKEVK